MLVILSINPKIVVWNCDNPKQSRKNKNHLWSLFPNQFNIEGWNEKKYLIITNIY
jgi:hypothetical protein